MSEDGREQPNDAFAAYKDAVDKTFYSMIQFVPRYHQSVTNMQQEMLDAIDHGMTATIQLQRDIAVNAGMPTSASDADIESIKEIAEGCTKLAAACNQAVLAAIDAAHQGIKLANDSSKSFNDAAHSAMRSWAGTPPKAD